MAKANQKIKSDRITRSRDKTLHKTVTKTPTKTSTRGSKNSSAIVRPGSDETIEYIENFNVVRNATIYLVKRKGYVNASWSTASRIEDKDKLREFHERIRTETGYVIQDKDANFNIENVSQRPGRTSKTRATFNLIRSHQAEEEDSDMETDKSSRKRKLNGESGRVVKKSTQLKSGRVRKLKADILRELVESARLERKETRSKLDPNVIMRKLKISDPKDCCLQCAATSYRNTMEKDNIIEFKKLLGDTERIPHYNEEKYHGCKLLNTAILGKKKNFIAAIKEFDAGENTGRKAKPSVPDRFKNYGMKTGFHVSRGFRSSTAFRTVQESRGNRQGNAAFYQSIFGSSSMTPENTLYQCSYLREFMSYIAKPIFKDKQVIDGFIELGGRQESLSVYFSVASGNYELAASIIKAGDNYFGHNFNHLFHETLKFNGEKKLTNYRKPQILKRAADLHGLTPFHCAAINRSSNYLKEFCEVLDAGEILETDTLNRTIAHFAAVSETTACLEYLVSINYTLTQPDKYKITPIVQAARFGRTHNVEFLIKHLSKDADEIPPTLFATAARNKRSLLHFAAFFGHTETCRLLINFGAPIDPVESMEKQTPLHYAAKNGFLDCVVVLIEEGKCNSSALDKYGRTALHLACIYGQFEVAKYLLSAGLDSNAPDSSQNLPIHYAAAFGYIEVLHLLIHFGGADPNKINLWRSTACSIANMKGHLSIVKYLLDLPGDCIDVNFKDQDGLSMLHHSVLENVTSSSEIDMNMRQIKLLLKMNAGVNSINLEGDTVMHSLVSITTYCNYYPKEWQPYYQDDVAKYNGYRATETLKNVDEDDMTGVNYHLDIGRMLLKKGADINILNNHGETCLSVAMKAENHYLVAFLIENGAVYWSDTDRDGNNFFHYFGKLAATIDQFQPHRAVDVTQKERFIQAANKVWDAVQNSNPDMKKLHETINKYNNNGRTPILDSTLNVVDFQKKAMAREKKQIKSKTTYSRNTYRHRFGSYNNADEETEESITPVKLVFTTTYWVHFMGLLLQKFRPKMNSRLQLPKGYKKANPKVKPSNYPRFTGSCAIHFAASIQNTEMIEFLIQNGSNPNLHVEIEGQEFDTPLIMAYHLKQDKNQEMENNNLTTVENIKKKYDLTKPDFEQMMQDSITVFLNNNADPFEINNVGVSSIMKAAKNLDLNMIHKMCQVQQVGKYSINTPNETDETALMMVVDAIRSRKELKVAKDTEIITLLLKAGADINKQFENGDTILLKIIRLGNTHLLNAVLNSAVVPIKHEVQNKLKENALIMVARLNNKEMIQSYVSCLSKNKSTYEQIINDVNMKGRSALSYVSLNGDAETLQTFMALNPNPNQHDINNIPLIDSIQSKNIEVVEILLKSGALVNTQNADGNTALHMAAASSKHTMVKLLLDYNVDCHIVNKKNQTPLHLAIDATKKQTNRSFKTERLLLEAGADINAKDMFGRTPFHYVFTDMNTIPITQDTTVIAKKVKQITKEIEEEKQKEDTLTKYVDHLDLNPKFYANKWLLKARTTQYDDSIQKKKSKSKKDDDEIQMTSEEKSVIRTYVGYKWELAEDSFNHFDPVDMVKYLSSFGSINYSVKDDFGRTPLHYAACVGAFTCTSFILKKGVDINDVDTDGNGALQLALRSGHVDYSGMLCDAGSIVDKKVVLKNGKESTTFGHALSLSLINIAYLIMERGVVIVEAIHDALKNGKFHMVELLLESADDSKLKENLAENDKNMWHIISDFKPFDSEIWGEYLPSIIQRIESLNLDLCLDNFNRSPIHYAAKHNQVKLLKYFLTLKDRRLNLFDEDGNSELDYAVESGNPEIIQLLLEAGSTVDTNSSPDKESILLKAVKRSHYQSVELLLKFGAKTDDDSSFGRANAVMEACVKNDLNMMKILVQASANLNTPSCIERTDENGKYKVTLHPVFVALPKDELFEFMVKSNVDLDVIGPASKPELAKPLFMFAVYTNNTKAQELMLNRNIDLNLGDADDTRTIFYEAFFSHMKFGTNDNKMTFGPNVYEQMIHSYRPNVNFVDTILNMTPLEGAIRQRKIAVVEHLLQLDANPNLESNGPESHFLNPEGEELPAFIHAALENDEKMFEMLVERSRYQINWLWKDTKNRNILSYILGGLNGYSQQSIDMLNYICKEAPSEFRKLAAMTDDTGKNPIIYAKATQNNALYQVFVKALPRSMTDDIDIDSQDMETEDVSNMDIDFISSLVVEEDANKERAILQESKDAKRLAKNKHANKNKEKKAVVDPYSNLEKVGVIAVDEDGSELDIMLLKAEFSYHVDCSFYKLSVIYNKVLDVYILWTRWGSLGEEGMHQRTPYLTKEEAAAEFKSIFKSKTSNHWEKRHIDFERIPGRYDILKTFTHPKDSIIKKFDFNSTNVPSQLSSSNLNLMKLICNFEYLSTVYNNVHIDMPFGQIPYKTIKEAQDILNKILEITDKLPSYNAYYGDKTKRLEMINLKNQVAQLTIDYHRLLPYKATLDKSVLETRRMDSFKKQLNRINDLSYVGFAVNVVLAAKHHSKEIHPLDYAYKSLECSLAPIAQESTEFSMINEYMNTTSNRSHELVSVFGVNREEESLNFRQHENDVNRKLLWHGSRIGNIMGILKQGLRAAPSTAANNGAMLGSGIYFADAFAKSVNYSVNYAKSYGSFYKVMFVCEVALGTSHIYKNTSNIEEIIKEDSVKAEGMNSPSPDCAVIDKHGVMVPMGPLERREADQFPESILLNHSEFCVYDKSRVKIRYLVIVKEKDQCSLCYTTNKNVKVLGEHNVKNFEFKGFNNYEAEVAKSYLSHEGKSIKDIYDEDLSAFLDHGLYKNKWKTPIDINANYRICTNCSYAIATSMLVNRIKSSEHNQSIPHSIIGRNPCKYGKECKNQNTLGHAKKYAHWFNDPIKKKNLLEEGDMDTDEDVEMGQSDENNDETEYETEEETEDESDVDGFDDLF